MIYRQENSDQRGFIALMSAIIISVLLLAITLSLGFSSFFTRFNILDSEDKEKSQALAEACTDTALANFAKDILYQVNAFDGGTVNYTKAEKVAVNQTDSCYIILVENNNPSGGNALIETQAAVNKSFTNIKIIIDSNTLEVLSWDQLPNL